MAYQIRDTNHEPYWELVGRIIKESDIVLEVLDARLVELSRNEEVERLIAAEGRPMIFVINKIDLVDKPSLKKQVEELEKLGKVVYISTKIKGSTKILLYNIKKMYQKVGKRPDLKTEKDPSNAKKLRKRIAKAEIVVGILGYPNVGKSSIINMLCHKKKMKVSKRPGTTHGPHWIRASREIKLIDSPGVIPLKKDDEIRYGLIGAKDTERLKHPDVVAHAIINLFRQKNIQRFEEFYGIKVESEFAHDIVDQIAEKKSFLLKGGIFDENRTCTLILHDWQEGKLRL